MKRKGISLFLASIIALSCAACGGSDAKTAESKGTEKTEKTDKAEKGDVVELKMLSLPANTSGLVEGWWAEEVKEKVGVAIDILPAGDQGEQKLQALMASGELPDLIAFKDYKQVENAVSGDMLLAFDDYKELLPDMYETVPEAIKYSADNLSDGKNKAFAVGTCVKNAMEIKGTKEPWLRYDLYKEIGSPKINDLQDYLPVLKKMQELQPTNADGQKVYGLSIWKDWDRAFLDMALFAGKFNGVEFANEGTLAEIDHKNGREIRSLVDENSFYLEFINFLYKAKQMGLLDPDSMTQRFDDATTKMGNGCVLMGFGDWGMNNFATQEKQNEGIGFMPVFTENNPTITEGLEPVGRTWTIAAGKASKHPEEAMKFINYFFSIDGAMTQLNGPKGVMWDLDESNKPVLTEEGYDYINNPEKTLPNGNTFVKGCPITVVGLNATTVHPEYGTPIGNGYWDKPAYAPTDTKLKDTWQEDFGAEDSIAYLTTKRGENNGLIPTPFIAQPIFTDEIEQISSRVGDVIKTISWKMVYAADDAEYETLKAEMIEKSEGLGIQKFVDWYSAEYNKALELGEKYTAK